MRGFYILSLAGLLLMLVSFGHDYARAESAPQQCVVVSMALLSVIAPYCLSRALAGLTRPDYGAELRKLNETLATHTKLLANVANNMPESPAAEENQ